MSIVERAIERVRRDETEAGAKHKVAESPMRQPQPVPASVALDQKLESIPIDYGALRTAGLLPPESERRRTTDEFRRIKWPLVRAAFSPDSVGQNRANLILVTSSLAGEGKSFVSVNLAFSIALERDCGVVLVDADLAKPQISEVFGARQKRGLTDLLAGRETDPAKVMLATDTPGFRLLPAGSLDPRAPELLASQRMHGLIGWLHQNCSDCIILFDSPPLLGSNEAQVLAQSAGQILLVICADKTPQSAVKDAVALIEEGNSKSIKCVLNQVNWLKPDNAYGTYYGEGYGQSAETAPRS
jgi:protein-tyrosine kinase